MTTVYKSKIDTWLLVVLVVAIGVSLYSALEILGAGMRGTWVPLLVTVGIGVVLPIWLLLGVRYTLQPGQLTVRSGPLRWRVPIADIVSVTPTKNPIASPALSLDRLRIEYGSGKSIMISPRDTDQFVRDLERLRRDAVGGSSVGGTGGQETSRSSI